METKQLFLNEDVGQGAPIVLLHGWGSEGRFFAPIINALKDRYRLIAPNFPGCGGSEIMDSPWTLADYEDFVLEFLNKLEIKPIIKPFLLFISL